ncbi:glycosyltransferase [Chryseobacterium salivictor]|uniref:Streptomycin biosynthesis protein StrF domain-containing protein n=1 Tax=Chryseobacterium salivictor TaxID=2547600 RepID=A0A4P6ZFT5_9FLAO|nr:glycosyltransferase [Chryseobacterium salivictor]QBO58352.1 hypothetical protein NBC122_01537 [Chryseobacterium salivictor]
MISIIICSRTPEISPQLFQNIEESIGYDYEIIVIDNSKKIYSIFEAYNIGIKNSKGNYWCFAHDDILLHTQNWGKEIKKIFENDEEIGLIGIAGSKIKTRMPSAWFDCDESLKVNSLIQHFNSDKVKLWERGWKDSRNEEVSVIDGVFMVGRKNDSIKFNEELSGFHNYDLNLSLAYKNANYKVIVTRNVLIEHFSIGKIDKSWYISALQFDTEYGRYLPLKVNDIISKSDFRLQELKNGTTFCLYLINNDLKFEAIKYWIKLISLKPVSKFHLHFIKLLLK